MTDRNIRRRVTTTQPAAEAPVVRTLRTARRTTLQETNGQRTVTADTRHGRATVSEQASDEVIDSVRFGPGEEPAFVRVGYGKTINTGDFNGVRIDVAVTLPCLPEDIYATHERAAAFSMQRLIDEEEYILGTVAPRTRANRRG